MLFIKIGGFNINSFKIGALFKCTVADFGYSFGNSEGGKSAILECRCSDNLQAVLAVGSVVADRKGFKIGAAVEGLCAESVDA